ncbi:MAG: histidine--tRNA ligase [Alphaproteobacteria bacterium]|nr:histidine--tRNA ligase [Alphaproteobacteria bacterium]
MKNNINLIKGTHDLVGSDIIKYNYILENFRNICNQFSFKEIITPIIEQEDLYVRGVGEMTDIVSKEMYTFLDQGDKKICLRPEATSGIARFAASNYESGAMKLFTYGPMFRRERPQKGRYRQFNQLNIEIIGDKNPYADFEVIFIASRLLESIGLKNKFKLLINSIGTKDDQTNYSKALYEFLKLKKNKLSEISQQRLEKNTLRILDSKDTNDQLIIRDAPKLKDFLSNSSIDFYQNVKNLLSSHGIGFIEDDLLVRGLDYYTHTAFEFQMFEEKRQNTILAGGRYDELISMISSRDIPGIGWAAGVERLIDLISIPTFAKNKKLLIAVQDTSYVAQFKLINHISKIDVTFEVKSGHNIKKFFTYADKNEFDYILLVGDQEFHNSSIVLKNLKSKEQKILLIKDLDLSNEIR